MSTISLSSSIELLATNFILISLCRVAFAGVYRRAIALRLPAPLLKRILSPSCLPADKVRKLHENLFYSVWHTLSFILVMCELTGEAWFHEMFASKDPRFTFADWPHNVPSSVKVLYLFELGFWLSCLVFMAVETIRKDFTEMIIHHIATIVLISLSYTYGYYRIGLVVMGIHDMGDIFLYSAKFMKYLNLKKPVDITFMIFFIVFFFSRLVIFPSFVRTAWGPLTGYLPDLDYRNFQGSVILPSLLTVLQILHVMWFVLIVRMILKFRKGEETKDIRSDEEGDEGDKDN